MNNALSSIAKIENTQVDSVNVRIYKPVGLKKDDKLPVIIYFHGGAYILCNIDSFDKYLHDLSKTLGEVIVIAVDYHLAPEYPWPRPVDDCFRVTKYVMTHPTEFNADSDRVILAGDSAGGNAVAVITQRLATSQLKMPKLQVLIYPWLQMYNALLPSEIQYNKKGFFSHTGFSFALYQLWLVGIKNPTVEMELAIQSNNHTLLVDDPNLRRKYQSYLDIDLIPVEYKTGKSYYDGYNNKKMQDFVYPTKIDTNNILKTDKKLARSLRQLLTTDASPGLAEDDLLKLLPKAYFIIAEWDTLKDQGLIYAERLRRNGVSTTINFAEHAFHGIVPLVDNYLGYDLARSILNDLVKHIKDNV